MTAATAELDVLRAFGGDGAVARPAAPDVLAVRTLRIPCAKADAVAVLHDLTTLARYEQKARRVAVEPAGDQVGWFSLSGRLAGLLPWRGRFCYVMDGDGYHSVADKRWDGWRITGGFVVRERGPAECEVIHYERFDLPRWAQPLRRLLTAYMRRSQYQELREIHDLALLRATESSARRRVVELESGFTFAR